MKTKIVSVLLLASLSLLTSQAYAQLTLCKMVNGTPTWNKNTNWRIGDTQNVPEAPPNSNIYEVQNQYGSSYMTVDGDFTVGKIGSNSDTGHTANTGKFTWDMLNSNAGSDGSITIDTAVPTSNTAIALGLSGQSKPEIYSQEISFKGGSVNIFNSVASSLTTFTIELGGSSAAAETAGIAYTKALTFESTNTLNVAGNLIVAATSGATKNKTQQFNFLGTTNVSTTTEGVTTYHNVNFNVADGNSVYRGSLINIGNADNTTAVFNSGSVAQSATTEVNVYGTMNVNGSYIISGTDSGARAKLNVESGATLNVKTPSNTSTTKIRFEAQKNTDVIVAGKILVSHNYDSSITSAGDYMQAGSTMTIKSGGEFKSVSANASIEFGMNANTTLVIEKGGLMDIRNQLRIAGDNATIKIYGENGLISGELQNRWKPIISSVNVRDAYIEIYENQNWVYLSWWGANTAQATATFHILLGDNVTKLSFDYLSEANGKDGMNNDYRFVEFKNFRNNTVWVKSINPNEADYMDNIYAEGYENFEYVMVDASDASKGYWLNAMQIPEASDCAIILGAIGLGLALVNRRRK